MTYLVVADPARLTGCPERWGILVKPEMLELWQCPAGAGVGQSRYAGVANFVAVEKKLLRMARMAHQTKLSGLENTHAKAQCMATRQ